MGKIKQKTEEFILGGHVSASGGPVNAIKNGELIGAEAIQIFGSSPRQWVVRMPTKEQLEEYHIARANSPIKQVFLHAPYLINLASPTVELREKSLDALVGHFKIAEALGAEGLIFHIGSGAEMERSKAFDFVVGQIKDTIERSSGNSMLLIENAASFKKIGATIEEIGKIIEAVDSPRVGMCYDTAHGFEAGLVDEYSVEQVERLSGEIKKWIGWNRLVAIHANDSKTKSGSHHDRHQNIGDGYIGKKGFANMLRDPNFRKLPWLLEVPGFQNTGPDKKNIEILKSLF